MGCEHVRLYSYSSLPSCPVPLVLGLHHIRHHAPLGPHWYASHGHGHRDPSQATAPRIGGVVPQRGQSRNRKCDQCGQAVRLGATGRVAGMSRDNALAFLQVRATVLACSGGMEGPARPWPSWQELMPSPAMGIPCGTD